MGLSKLLPSWGKRSKKRLPEARKDDDKASSAEPAVQDLPSAPVPDFTSSHAPDGPQWARAFEILKERDPKLMADYEAHLQTHLASLQSDATTRADLASPGSVELIVKHLLEMRERKRWRITTREKDVIIRDLGEKFAEVLLYSDSLVKSALCAQPYAALAWSSVSLLLPLLASNTKQNAAMLKGFAKVGHVQLYWSICARTYLTPPYQQWYKDLFEPLTDLYSHVIEYQVRVICHLSEAQHVRAWQDVAGSNAWDGKVDDIEELSGRHKGLIPHFNKQEIRRHWSLAQQKMEEILCTMKAHHSDDKEAGLFGDLARAAKDYGGDKKRVPERVPGTCEWFLTDDRFRKWRDSKESGVLWVSAGPGFGKTVLSRTLIDEGLLTTGDTDATCTIDIAQSTGTPSIKTFTGPTSTICYSFFKDGGGGPMDGAQALCAMLHQLFEQKHDPTGELITKALPRHKIYGETLTRIFFELWQILLECAGSPDREIVCIIDALDECQEESRREVIGTLKEFCSSPASGIKFLVTSRPYDDIERSFRKFASTATYLRFDGNEKAEQTSQEIDLVIDVKVKAVAEGFSDEHRVKISERLKQGGHRTYLWLHLTLDIVENHPDEYGRFCDIEELLSDLPKGVPEAYEKILSRHGSGNEHRTETLLRIILAAERPLTLEEANIALTSALQPPRSKSHSDLVSHMWPENNFQGVVTGLCGLFITVYDSKLFFIHQTAREFLTHSTRGIWQGRFNIPSSHTTMSSVCLHYLLLPGIDSELGERPLLSYAAAFWPSHYVLQEASDADQSRKDARALCDVNEDRVQLWMNTCYAFMGGFALEFRTDLILASYFGLTQVVNDILLEGNTDVDCMSHGFYGTALQAASGGGRTETVTALLDRGAEVNKGAGFWGTALRTASARGYMDVVRTLLDRGAEVDQVHGSDHSKTALEAASAEGHTEIVKTLLDRGADVNKAAGAALQTASENGRTEIVRFLLDKGAKVDEVADYHGPCTALQAASVARYTEVVKILLDRGADVNMEAGDYGTALQAASEEGVAETVRVLLDKGAEVNKVAGKYGTALQAASAGGYTEVVRILLDRGADVNMEAGDYGTALQAASYNNRTKIVRTLLDLGADVNREAGGWVTALQAASTLGHTETVKPLLDAGADICKVRDSLGTALRVASAGGHAQIIETVTKYAIRITCTYPDSEVSSITSAADQDANR